MKITEIIDIVTKDNQETFEMSELVGKAAPFAYHINYKNRGYAKFNIDKKSLLAFEEKLIQIEDSMSRK